MIKSKTLKSTPKRFMRSLCSCPDECKPECGYGAIFHSVMRFIVFKLYYPVLEFFTRNKERLGRSFAYAKFGWLNFDFDMAYVYELFEFKLKRLRECLQSGHAVQESEDMAALNELIKIVKRLRMDQYEDKYYDQHDKKWGKIQSRSEPYNGANGKHAGSRWFSWRKNCPENASEEIKKQERKDMKKCWENAEKDRVKDIRKMADILIKNGQNFWD